MADSGQRLLDVIDDPNALESFLGCLASDGDGEVDNAVESLARSLAAEFEVGSPSDTLFEPHDSSSSNLTDLSQSNVPFDFGTSGSYTEAQAPDPFPPDPPDLSQNQAAFADPPAAVCDSTSPPSEPSYAQQQPTNSLPPPSSLSAPGTVSSSSLISTAGTYSSSPSPQYAQLSGTTILGMGAQGLGIGGGQFIIDSSGQPMMVTTGGGGLALVQQPTYAVLPTSAPLFSMSQSTLQSIKTSLGGTSYFQTAPTVMATSIQNLRPKQPPQLLPKPAGGGGNASPSHATAQAQPEPPSASSAVVTSSGGQTITMTTANMESLSQIIQQQSTAGGGMSIGQPSFAIGAGGQVMQVSGMQGLNTMSGQQIVVNQFGQQMLMPAATMNSGIQYILRQQPTQQQVLTIQQGHQATAGTGPNGKPIVRFMSQISQLPAVNQNQQQQIQLQQIQTANGPTWVVLRPPTNTQNVQSVQQQAPMAPPAPPISVSAPQGTPVVRPTPPPVPKARPAPQPQPKPPVVVPVTTDTISAAIQSVISRLRSPSPPPATVAPSSYSPTPTALPDGPPPKKKAKSSKKKKVTVTLDLEQLLKQSGIMDEDLADDGSGGFGDFFSSCSSQEEPEVPAAPVPVPVLENGFSHPKPTNNNTLNNNLNNNNYKANGLQAHVHVLKPSAKTKQKSPKVPQLAQPPPAPLPETPKKAPPKKSKKRPPPPEEPKVEPIPPPAPAPKSKKKKPAPTAAPEVPAPPTATANIVTPPKKAAPKKKKAPPPKVEPPSPPATPPTTPATTTRIVQTIQLTPQNQQLLRNIQAQIQRLLSLPKRNETEQTALQKLIVLQQQVIGTGTPVPNPTHLQTLSGTQGAVALKPGTDSGVTVLKGPIPTATSVAAAAASAASSTLPKPIQPAPPPVSTSSIEAQFLSQTNSLYNNSSCSGGAVAGAGSTEASNTPKPAILPHVPNGTDPHPSPDPPNKIQLLLGNQNIKSEPGTAGDKVTSSSITATTTTTLSTANSSSGSYNGSTFYHSPQQQAQALLEEKRLEEQLIARLKADEETRIKWRKEEFEARITKDQKCFREPDYVTPFRSEADVIERLMKYHVGRDRNQMSFEEFDEDFADTSVHLLDKFNGMIHKYRALLLKESLKEVVCAERVMLERIFVGEEKVMLDHDRQAVAQGEILNLAPPPPSWIPKIKELVEADMKEMERDSIVNQQVQSAIDSIITFGNNEASSYPLAEEGEKIEYDAFGVAISSSYNNSSSSADIDEAVRSILI